MTSKFPPPWSFKLTWAAHRDKMISKFPPMELEIHIECPDRKDVIKIPTFMELQIDLDRSQKQ